MGIVNKIATLNTRGLAQGWRWDQTLATCNLNNIKILCLQETHNVDMSRYLAGKDCKYVFSGGTKTQGGVALIVLNACQAIFKEAFSIEGRVV